MVSKGVRMLPGEYLAQRQAEERISAQKTLEEKILEERQRNNRCVCGCQFGEECDCDRTEHSGEHSC